MKKIILILSLILLALLLINLTSATIILSQLSPTYNLGDIIKFEVKVSQPSSLQGFFKTSLFCNNIETLMYFSPISLEKDKEKTITINFPLANSPLGSCYILSTLEDSSNKKIEETKSSSLTLSNKIALTIALNKKEFSPGDNLQLSGTAVKANGQEVEGIAVILFNDKEHSTTVSKGKFAFTQKLEATIPPGEHSIIINVKDNNNNLGEANTSIKVLEIPTNLIIETNNESFLPDSLLMITPKLLDQANNTLAATMSIRLTRQISLINSETLLEELIESGNSTLYRFTKFHKPGNYVLEASTQVNGQNFNAKKTIIIERYEKVSVDLKADTLYISNIGNVPFKRPIEIEFLIEDKSYKKLIDLDLKINESKTFKLEAPKGTYDIIVNTGSETLTFKKVPLTGSVVATIDLEKSTSLDLQWLWIIVVIIAILIIIVLALKTDKKHKARKKELMKAIAPTISIEQNQQPHQKTEKKEIKEKISVDSFPSTESTIKRMFLKHSAKLAANSIVPTIVYGTKQEVTALFMHLDLNKLEEIKKKDAKLYIKILDEYFASITDKIKEHQGVADLYGNNLLVLFNVIKQYRHDIAALKTAEAIRKITLELNNALASAGSNISLAVKAGINTGFVNMNAIQNNEVKYTSIGNTISFAKTLEAKAIAGEILFPEKIYERVANVIKAKKLMPHYLNEQHAINIYSLEDSSKKDFREKHEWYVKRALGKV